MVQTDRNLDLCKLDCFFPIDFEEWDQYKFQRSKTGNTKAVSQDNLPGERERRYNNNNNYNSNNNSNKNNSINSEINANNQTRKCLRMKYSQH